MVVDVYRDWPGPQYQTCTFKICNFHFHYGSNLTSSSILVKNMQNVNCTLKLWENTMQKTFHKLSIFSVEKAKVKNCCTMIMHMQIHGLVASE